MYLLNILGFKVSIFYTCIWFYSFFLALCDFCSSSKKECLRKFCAVSLKFIINVAENYISN